MKKFKHLKVVVGLTLSAFLFTTILTSCKKNNNDVDQTISQIAVSMDGFSQLEAAAIQGGVAGVLSNKNPAAGSDGNYTVFAPTNEAFAKIGLVKPADLTALQNAFLTNVLLYHVSNGNTLESALTDKAVLPSLLTPTKRIIKRGNDLYVNGSKIIATNVKADNGIIHVVDRVLLASGADIANTTIFFSEGKGFVQPELTYLLAAVKYAGLVAPLADPNANLMVFAPTNQAFINLGKLLGVPLNQPSDIEKLPKDVVTKVLLTHVFNLTGGARFTSELYAGAFTSLNGQTVTLGTYNNGYLTVKGAGNSAPANMLIPDVQCTNGIVHVIDTVLLPQ
ncbi:fasciclin domain-containing protein [Pedobacter sp. SD-b]|uniref:Fasciclin domain-containing protein n=1 Tax=Pedobacter segetis TaxID=2793069 RepID=A0ABS1BP45_9SPHI|nr:fasciclin domain-containing protein [Pedobacter segetis]MBK0384131.1 fasciclin domain-containing protein [Pedobacter segetis]